MLHSVASLADDRFVLVPAREGRAVPLAAGERFRVIDVEGGQVCDLFAFSADDMWEYASAEHTRVALDRLFPGPGQSFVTNRRRPILRLEEDRSPGVHDMLCAACDPARYRQLGVHGWHASCQENLQPGDRRRPRLVTSWSCARSSTAWSWRPRARRT